MAKVLVADDERSICEAFAALIAAEGQQPLIAANGLEALDIVRREQPAAVFLDVRMPGQDGLATLAQIHALSPATPVIIMTAYGTLQTAATAFSHNAFDYLGKPLELAQARQVLRRALQHAADNAAATALAATDAVAGRGDSSSARPGGRTDNRATLIGRSAAMQEIFKLIVLLAGNDLSVLIQGESGVGKELVARAVHAQGARAALPFVAVNCAAIPENLIESELFGHEKGAFTDAREARAGRFETAGRGTLLLDEISEMPLHLQSKLLRVLQERSFERIGSSRALAFNARLIAASNQDLQRAVRNGKFRADLYHRLNIVAIQVPPLRERRDDIPLLIDALLIRANAEVARQVRSIAPAALVALQQHDWPGNARELEHTLKRAVLMARGDTLTLEDLQLEVPLHTSGADSTSHAAIESELQQLAARLLVQTTTGEVASTSSAHDPELHGTDAYDRDLYDTWVGRFEAALVAAALRRTVGNRAAAAKLLGISRATLRAKLPGVDEDSG